MASHSPQSSNEYFHLFRQSQTVIIVEIDHHDAYGKTILSYTRRVITVLNAAFTEEVKRVQIYIC